MASGLAVVGVSLGPTCGVRDHAELLAEALRREGVSCRVHWLSRSRQPLGAARSEIGAWARELGAELHRDPPDAVLLHYSVFAYSHRGVPLFVRPTLSALRGVRAPLVAELHEYAYPWTRKGWRGKVLALTQRALLIELMRASTAIVLTTDFRAEWIASRRWLPRRRIAVAPVFSNLPVATVGSTGDRSRPADGRARPADDLSRPADGWSRPADDLSRPADGWSRPADDLSRPADGWSRPTADLSRPTNDRLRPTVGLFGYSAEGAAVSVTLDSVRLLQDRGVPVQLNLLGAPGRASPAGEMWLDAAHARQVASALSFSDILPPQELSNALAACDVLLFAETTGPTSRKTTLAASLASGQPVIALDGPRRWAELVEAGAALIVPPTGNALADAIQTVLADERVRASLGARGGAFAMERMSAARSAATVSSLLDEMLVQPGVALRSDRQLEQAVR